MKLAVTTKHVAFLIVLLSFRYLPNYISLDQYHSNGWLLLHCYFLIEFISSLFQSHIDLVVACPQGRKPPVVQDIENYSPGKFSDGGGDHSKRRASTGFSDDDEENPSAVARAIKQFESKKPRKSEFLERRDSLEKARNSLRLYKEKKRSTMFGGSSTGSPGTQSGASSSPSLSKVMMTTPAKKRSEDVAKSHGLGGSLDSLTSPRMNKASAFSMPDPKSVSIITPNRSQKLGRLGGSFDESEAGTPARENEARQVR